MTNDYAQWQLANDQFLSDSLAWLRERLEHLAGMQTQQNASQTLPAKQELAMEEAMADAMLPPITAQAKRAPETPPKRSLMDFLFGTHTPDEARAKNATVAQDIRPRQSISSPQLAAPETPSAASDAALPAPPAALMEAFQREHPPAIALLAQRLGLSDFERNLLLLCVAMEMDTRIPALCARAQRDVSKPYPTYALAMSLFDQPAWDVMSPERPLRYWRLIEIIQPGTHTLTASALRADERIVNYVKGLNYLDDRLVALLAPLSAATSANDYQGLPNSQLALCESILRSIDDTPHGTKLPTIQLLGIDSLSKKLIAERVAHDLGLTVYRISPASIPAANVDLDSFARIWQRESILLPLGLYVDALDIDRADALCGITKRWISRCGGVVFLDAREAWEGLDRTTMNVDVAKPTPVEQREAWRTVLSQTNQEAAHTSDKNDKSGIDVASSPIAQDLPRRLAGQFNFNVSTIQQIADEAQTRLRRTQDSSSDAITQYIWEACLAHARPTLDQLAQRLDAKATWDDLKLPPHPQSLLRQIAAQVAQRSAVYDDFGFRQRMNRGLGISVLFSGESGTGKTMAAEVLANALGMLLYRIDLSAVVSKYIGETEKNLRKLFDAAEDGGAILFFDEADALFGKRSEVKDSHDRYANIEINYLLQRMESYQGLAILATNLKSSLDTAFMRRLRFIINFPFPAPAERKAMWQRAFPASTPLGALDYERLARLNITGGSIQNIALNSAFVAAHRGSEITMPLLLEAAKDEFRKLEKPINEADFRWLESAEGVV
jgi:ATPase family associated with various cellular activities (AAA)